STRAKSRLDPAEKGACPDLKSIGRLCICSLFGIWVLGFEASSASAQVPNAPQSAVQLPPAAAPPGIPVRTNSIIRPTGAAADSSPGMRTSPRPTTQLRTNSIINPSPASTNLSAQGPFTVIT